MRVTRGTWLDWYVDGDDSAVFVDGHVVVLSALATTLVSGLTGTATVDELSADLVARYGEPEHGDAAAVTKAAVRTLLDAGVLVEEGLRE